MNTRKIILSAIPATTKKTLRKYFKFQPQDVYYKIPKKVSNEKFEQFFNDVIEQVKQNPSPIINNKTLNPKLQRSLDIIIASLLYLPSKVITGCARAILKLSDPQYGTIYKTKRIGQYGKMVSVRKLHSMESLSDGVHVMSKFAIFLRKHGIDELPQIENVFKDDFSFMGPRPVDNKTFYTLGHENGTEFLVKRLRVKPGFGFGYEKGRTYPEGKTLPELEREKFEHFNLKTYFETIYELAKTMIKGNNL